MVSRMSQGHLRIVVAVLLTIQGSLLRAANSTPILVLANGDDGLTSRLRNAIETSSRSSADLRLVAAGLEPGTLTENPDEHTVEEDWKQDQSAVHH
jgi:hypothetical protein